ncbi:hypothetical protein [Arthrobacter sp. BE255]|nr:hypothetical protein [Arthrobacter sp. BE255]MDR7161341.1 hypothetical protein [Arthrobacter sp. BE255]
MNSLRQLYDDGGTRLGRVADARFVVDGAPGQLMAEARSRPVP